MEELRERAFAFNAASLLFFTMLETIKTNYITTSSHRDWFVQTLQHHIELLKALDYHD